uniref:BSD domain-containing protein n=1 Tax=Rhizophora mucronata TaxID=61149 RepID=A0A2P2Q604_RHIMU
MEEKDDGGEGYAPGITREVIDFVQEISRRPECWTDFPLPLDHDFRMSDSQQEHASTVEQMVPSFRALRTNVCSNMGVEQFWMVYFILLLPRLNEHDFEFLSTPQIVEMRNRLLQMLKNKRNEKVELSPNPDVLDTSQVGSKVGEPQRDSTSSSGKEVAEIVNATEILEIDAEENTDQWLGETDIETGTSVDRERKLEEEEEEDVSFSDLEDDDNDISSRLSASRKAQSIKAPSRSGSSDWEQLNKNSEAQTGLQKARPSISRDKDSDVESNDWLKVDDSD